jgi:hypothetical protein
MTPRRYELSDFEWSTIEPLLPNKPRGVPRSDDRKVLNGIYWRLSRARGPRSQRSREVFPWSQSFFNEINAVPLVPMVPAKNDR